MQNFDNGDGYYDVLKTFLRLKLYYHFKILRCNEMPMYIY